MDFDLDAPAPVPAKPVSEPTQVQPVNQSVNLLEFDLLGGGTSGAPLTQPPLQQAPYQNLNAGVNSRLSVT